MSDVIRTIFRCVATVAVIGFIVYGITYSAKNYNEKQYQLRSECIAAGGMIIETNIGFHCIRK